MTIFNDCFSHLFETNGNDSSSRRQNTKDNTVTSFLLFGSFFCNPSQPSLAFIYVKRQPIKSVVYPSTRISIANSYKKSQKKKKWRKSLIDESKQTHTILCYKCAFVCYLYTDDDDGYTVLQMNNSRMIFYLHCKRKKVLINVDRHAFYISFLYWNKMRVFGREKETCE